MDFALFTLMLVGIALFHKRALPIALAGLTLIVLYKLWFTGFKTGPGLVGLRDHLLHEWVIVANLFALLTSFALLSRHFEETHVPTLLLRILPADWKGGFVLLGVVFVLSGFLDNIAAALLGATMAGVIFRHKVHIGYLAAVVGAANVGGAGSVLGDTTTTMMWIAGVPALEVLDAYIAALAAFLVFAIPASLQQQRHAPMEQQAAGHICVDWPRVGIVVTILLFALSAIIATSFFASAIAGQFPVIGTAIWLAILVTTPIRGPDWSVMPEAVKGSVFLLALVLCASLMSVEQLPSASWQTTFALGVVSSVFDNIPLTALALKQGGYDWGLLAYAVGFGGSMIWFGSSAGVAVSNTHPEAKSVGRWLVHGWHVPVAYVTGFVVLLGLLGWNPV